MIHTPNFEQDRFNLIEQQIRPWHVNDPEVLYALKTIHREDFVPNQYINLAFADSELKLELEGRYLLSPKIEARIIQEIKPFIKTNISNILIIGSDLGYLAAILCFLQAKVSILDESSELLQTAVQNLTKYNYKVTTLTQNFISNLKEKYNIIIITGSVDRILPHWLEALEDNGVIFAFVGQAPVLQAKLIIKQNNTINEKDIFDTWVQPLPNIKPQSHFAFDNKVL